PAIVLWVLLQAHEGRDTASQEMALADAVNAPGGPGRVFNLDARNLTEILNRLRDELPEWAVRVVRTAGLDVLRVPRFSKEDVLERYYSSVSLAEVGKVVV